MAAIAARSADKRVSYHDLHNLSTGDLLFYEKKKIRREKFPYSPILIMHARLINYAFYSLSLNTIDNSLGN